MNFYAKRKGPPIVPIIPMIDILSILLVFFIVYTEKKQTRPAFNPELPATANLPTVNLRGTSSILAVAADGSLALDGMSIPSFEMLPDYLKSFASENQGRRVELELDQSLPLGRVIFVWDALTQAGYEVKDVPLRVKSAQTETKPSST